MNTKQIRQTILDLAIRGELVPQDPTDEPASVLLKRIHAEKEQLIKDKKLKRDKKDNEPIDEVPFELPEGWEWCRLGEIIVLLSGQDLNYKEYNETQQGIPYIIGASNFHKGRLNINRWTEFGKNIAEKGEILVTCKGTVGEISILEIDKVHIARQIMSIKAILCYQKYILYFLSFRIKDLKEKANGLIPGISREDLLYQLIPLPPLAEQHRIAKKVEQLLTIVDTIEQLQEELKALVKQTKNQVLNYAIAGKLTYQDPNDEPAEELLKRIGKTTTTAADTPYEKLPKGWACTQLQVLCQLLDGEKKEAVSLPYLDVAFLRGRTESNYKESGRYIPKNTHLILVDGENSGEIFTTTTEGYQGSTLKILNISKEINEQYLFYVLKKEQQLFKESKTGSAIPHLNKKLFKELKVLLPPLAEQHRIVQQIETFFASFDQIEKELA